MLVSFARPLQLSPPILLYFALSYIEYFEYFCKLQVNEQRRHNKTVFTIKLMQEKVKVW